MTHRDEFRCLAQVSFLGRSRRDLLVTSIAAREAPNAKYSAIRYLVAIRRKADLRTSRFLKMRRSYEAVRC